MSKVTVIATEGQVIKTSEKNPEYGSIRLEQKVFEFNNRGFLTPKNRVAFIRGKISDLQLFGVTPGKTLDGRIVIEETLVAPNSDDATMGMKKAFEGGPNCLVNDQPIYRNSFYSPDAEVKDTLIQHTNVEEIRAASKQQKIVAAETEATLA